MRTVDIGHGVIVDDVDALRARSGPGHAIAARSHRHGERADVGSNGRCHRGLDGDIRPTRGPTGQVHPVGIAGIVDREQILIGQNRRGALVLVDLTIGIGDEHPRLQGIELFAHNDIVAQIVKVRIHRRFGHFLPTGIIDAGVYRGWRDIGPHATGGIQNDSAFDPGRVSAGLAHGRPLVLAVHNAARIIEIDGDRAGPCEPVEALGPVENDAKYAARSDRACRFDVGFLHRLIGDVSPVTRNLIGQSCAAAL